MTTHSLHHTPQQNPATQGRVAPRRIKKRYIAAVLTMIWIYGFFWFANETRGYVPVLQDKSLDAIIVLTGGSNRIATGFDLLEQKQAGKLFISGVYKGVEASELLKSWRSSSEDLSCCITLGYEAENTRENAREVANWLSKENIHSVYLVTSNYHMKRALLELKSAAPETLVTPYPVTPLDADIESWWRGSDTVLLMVREYAKYSLAIVRHFLLP